MTDPGAGYPYRLLEGLKEGFIPCYRCNTFKPIAIFLKAQTSGRYPLQGCCAYTKFCTDCGVDGRALDSGNGFAQPTKFQPNKVPGTILG